MLKSEDMYAVVVSALHPGGIFLSGIQKTVLTTLEYLYLRVPRCTQLWYAPKLGHCPLLHLRRFGFMFELMSMQKHGYPA